MWITNCQSFALITLQKSVENEKTNAKCNNILCICMTWCPFLWTPSASSRTPALLAFLPVAGQLSTVCAARPAGHWLCSFSYTFSTSLFLLVFPVPLFSHVCFCADFLCCIVLPLAFHSIRTVFFYRPHLICIENVESICSDRIITYECDR